MKLSPAQKTFLAEFAHTGYRTVPGGFHKAGIYAAAYYRTERSLMKLGLVARPYPDQWTKLTWQGLAWTVVILKGEA